MAAPVVEKGYVTAQANWWAAPDDVEETPELIWPFSIEVLDRMRRQDPQVISVLRAVILPIRRTNWRIDQARARDEVAARVATDFGLPLVGQEKPPARSPDRFSWAEHLRLALLMLVFGHSIFEQNYRIDAQGLARLHKLAWRPPRTISRIDVAPDGGLVAIHQHPTQTRSDPEMGVDRLVCYVHEREGGNWLGQSLLRPAYKPWLLKDRALRTQSLSLDRNGLGVPIYEGSQIPETVLGEERTRREQDELAKGLEIATKYRGGENAGASIPHGAKLLLKGVDGRLPSADAQIRYYDEQIARAVLAHFLNLGTETGSWALGSTFADFFVQSLQTEALAVADVTNRYVIEDLVETNWGPDEEPPRLVFDEIGSRHGATAEAIKALVDCGAIVPDQPLEQFLRVTYGLPLADPNRPDPQLGPQPGQTPSPQPGRVLTAVAGGPQ